MCHDLRLYRIQMDIAAGLQKISVILNQAGLISSLKEMSHAAIFPVVIVRIIEAEILHDIPDRGLPSLQQPVVVIVHQSETMQNTVIS